MPPESAIRHSQSAINLPPAIFLTGPTASGKTGVAVELLQTFPVEIISVDSALVYRGMNIGTAKPDAQTLAAAPHHLIDIIDPTAAYSAAAFRRDALKLINEITARGKIPLLVGGTMLYFKVLKEGLSPLPVADAAVRAELDTIIAQHGIAYLHRQLANVDPVSAARLSPNDTQRIGRAMEIYHLTGRPMSELFKLSPLSEEEKDESGGKILPFQITSIALIPSDRSILHKRIETRFKQMLQQGLIDELRDLRGNYSLHPELPSMRCVGYRQAWQYMENEISEARLIETGIIATRQLAKRQLTWLRSMADKVELDCLSDKLTQQVRNALRL